MKSAICLLIWFIWVFLCPTLVYLIASYVCWDWWSFAEASADQRGGFLFGTCIVYALTWLGPAILNECIHDY